MKIENYDCEEEYDKLSKIYDKWASPTWPDDDNIQGLINFIKTFPGGRRILELGVGTGNVAINYTWMVIIILLVQIKVLA